MAIASVVSCYYWWAWRDTASWSSRRCFNPEEHRYKKYLIVWIFQLWRYLQNRGQDWECNDVTQACWAYTNFSHSMRLHSTPQIEQSSDLDLSQFSLIQLIRKHLMEAVSFLNNLESSTLKGLGSWQVVIIGSLLLLTTLLILWKLPL